MIFFCSKFIFGIFSFCLIINEAHAIQKKSKSPSKGEPSCKKSDVNNLRNDITMIRVDMLDLRTDIRWLKQQFQQKKSDHPSCAAELLINGPRFKVPDSAFTESTPHPGSVYNPTRARLDTQPISGYAGSWASGKNDVNQYIQVDLQKVFLVQGVITQGRSDHDQWVTSYKVQRSTTGSTFYEYTGQGKTAIEFSGNTDRNTKVRHEFTVPFEAKYIRINPLTWHAHISMRFDILGCPNSE